MSLHIMATASNEKKEIILANRQTVGRTAGLCLALVRLVGRDRGRLWSAAKRSQSMADIVLDIHQATVDRTSKGPLFSATMTLELPQPKFSSYGLKGATCTLPLGQADVDFDYRRGI